MMHPQHKKGGKKEEEEGKKKKKKKCREREHWCGVVVTAWSLEERKLVTPPAPNALIHTHRHTTLPRPPFQLLMHLSLNPSLSLSAAGSGNMQSFLQAHG